METTAQTNGSLDALKEIFTVQIGRFGDKVDNLKGAVENGFADIKKILDDHEDRLRKQVEIDSQQGRELGDLRVSVKALEGEVKALGERMASMQRTQEEKAGRELDFWQKLALEAVKFAAFGGAGGGVIVAVLRALGVI